MIACPRTKEDPLTALFLVSAFLMIADAHAKPDDAKIPFPAGVCGGCLTDVKTQKTGIICICLNDGSRHGIMVYAASLGSHYSDPDCGPSTGYRYYSPDPDNKEIRFVMKPMERR